MKYLPIFLFLFALTSCETLVNTIPEDKLPKTESQLTMFCFISPQDTVIRVNVGETRPLFSEYDLNASLNPVEFIVVNGDTIRSGSVVFRATVTISDGKTKATIPYDKGNRYFALPASQFSIRAGQTYTLTVTDGKRTAQATCTVPTSSVPIKKYSLDTALIANFSRQDTALVASFLWDDIAGQADYYRVRVYEEQEIPVFNFEPATKTYVESRQRVAYYFYARQSNGQNGLINDINLDGTTLSSTQFERRFSNLYYGGYSSNNYPVVDGKKLVPKQGQENLGVHLLLNHTDFPYYEFHRSLQKYNGDNPFVEPSLIYTNVKGGFGVFASFNQSTKVIKP